MPSELPPETAPASRPARTILKLLGIDRRSLACFRIGLACLLLCDLYGRARTLRMHYTGEGVFPRELAAAMRPDSALFRVFLLSDRAPVQAALFWLFALVALALVLGWRTRLASVLAFVLLASLVRRNPYVCHTGDVLLKALSFWAMFLPLGAHFSIDRLRSRARTRAGERVLSLGTAGALLQVAIFYGMAGILKARYDVWRSGEAVWTFTHVIEYTRPFGAWLGQFPLACRFLTFATLALEGLAPLLLFFPFATARVRTVLFLVFAAFHLTLQATIHIGIFQILCIVMLTLFLPGEFWDGLGHRLPMALRARWPRWRDVWTARLGRLLTVERFIRLLTLCVVTLGLLILCVVTVQRFISLLILSVVGLTLLVLRPLWGWLVPRLPGALRARWRTLCGILTAVVLVSASFVRLAFLVLVLAVIVVSNVNSAVKDPYDREDRGPLPLPQVIDDYGREMSLVQSWNMFTDIDRLFFGWFLVLGQQEDGLVVDVLERAPFRELRLPEHYARSFPNHNSRRYWRELTFPEREFLQKPMCDYLAREWERAGGPPLTHLAIFHVGRVPSSARADDKVKLVCRWEAQHEPLKSAPSEVQQRWTAWRESWNRFLAGLPETVPAGG